MRKHFLSQMTTGELAACSKPGEVHQITCRLITATIDSYKENSVEDPKTLKEHCKEEKID